MQNLPTSVCNLKMTSRFILGRPVLDPVLWKTIHPIGSSYPKYRGGKSVGNSYRMGTFTVLEALETLHHLPPRV